MTTDRDIDIETTADLRRELRVKGFLNVAYVTLQGPSGVENHLRVTTAELTNALQRADEFDAHHHKFRAKVTYRENDRNRYIVIDGYQPDPGR
jgi:hypothetical protein